MALEMKGSCQTCGTALQMDSDAYICVYECTFCPDCSSNSHHICPNCGGELVRRPRKMTS
ncbi:DUF1272 domain-containing protein [Paenibacillus tarimensis]|uniref:DUF1272 domain-containing protein n=1 Tax=Paenibacillus tarimensis TaxID=416012 RepID=UPI001F18326D|nr:DUF1272 domain-containing protein [Paenibacillus tarimensis]MCF2946385.1 DUF1272 domain-containing protein [Paenibacillus tarimensis]